MKFHTISKRSWCLVSCVSTARHGTIHTHSTTHARRNSKIQSRHMTHNMSSSILNPQHTLSNQLTSGLHTNQPNTTLENQTAPKRCQLAPGHTHATGGSSSAPTSSCSCYHSIRKTGCTQYLAAAGVFCRSWTAKHFVHTEVTRLMTTDLFENVYARKLVRAEPSDPMVWRASER